MKLTFYSPARRPNNEEQRQQVASDLRGRGPARPDELRAIVEEAAQLLDCPAAAITILDGDRQWIVDAVGTPIGSTSRAVSFCAHAILQPQDVLCIPDARLDRRFAGNPLVMAENGLCFYAGAPVEVGQAMIGALCALDTQPRPPLDDTQRERLKTLAAAAAKALSGD